MKTILLMPFTIAYFFINIFWNFYWKLRKPVRINSKIISVGNIAVGGSGKTTVAGFIAGKLLAEGKRTAIVARGYARPEKRPVVVHSGSNIDWRKCGDEPAALARSIEGLTIYVDANKTSAALRAAKDGFEYIIIDDGFQHRGLYRDIDIVCIEGEHPFGNGLLLPSGSLRERKKALKRADIIVIMDPPPNKPAMGLKTAAPTVKAYKKVVGVKSVDGSSVDISNNKLVAFCGLGNPDSFRGSLANCDCEITEFIRYRDHHIYGRGDLDRIMERIRETGAAGAITTLKDLVKAESIWDDKSNLYYLETAIELENENDFFKLSAL
jgi:tetraacyldisaccharide 4'-kinase